MMVKAPIRSQPRRAAAFFGIGAINTVVDFSAFACFYHLVGFNVIASNVMAFAIAVTSSYALNVMITFADRSGRRGTLSGFGRFLLVALIALGASTTIVYFVSIIVHPLLAKLAAIVASTAINYIGCYRFVFSVSGKVSARGALE